jgi:hypothetical protein
MICEERMDVYGGSGGGGGGGTFSNGNLFEKRNCGLLSCAFLVPLVAPMAEMIRGVCMYA